MTNKEIIKRFADHCDECGCYRCLFRREFSVGGCLDSYLEKICSGEMKPEGSFEDANPEYDDDAMEGDEDGQV